GRTVESRCAPPAPAARKIACARPSCHEQCGHAGESGRGASGPARLAQLAEGAGDRIIPMRLGAIFVAVCMVIIAGSAGAIVYFYFGVGAAGATGVAIAALAALALYDAVAARIGARTTVGRQLSDLPGGVADRARQVGAFARRLAALETRIEDAVDRTRAATDPLTVEIGELGTLLTQLADTVADHQLTLDALARVPVPPPAPAPPPAAVLAAEALAQRLAAAIPLAAAAPAANP